MLYKQIINNKKIIFSWHFTSVMSVLLFSGMAFAVSAEYSQSYKSNQELHFGSLVSLDKSSTNIILATTENAKNFLGVYIADSGSTLAVNKSDEEKQVAVNGRTVALASTINGPINKGDLLTISPIGGVAALASESDQVIGSANTAFDEANIKNTKTEIITAGGNKKETIIGPIEIDLFRIQKNTATSQGLLDKLEQTTGKPISTLKLVMIALLSVALIGAIGSMSYAAIRTSIVQSSRNPLAQPVIMQSLAKIVFIIVLTSIVGVSLIYLVIRI